MVGSYEHSNEFLVFMKAVKFRDYLKDHQLLKQDSAPWTSCLQSFNVYRERQINCNFYNSNMYIIFQLFFFMVLTLCRIHVFELP